MAFPLIQHHLSAGLVLLLGGFGPAAAQGAGPPTPLAQAAPDALDTSLSPECRVPGSLLYTLGPLQSVQAALEAKRPVRVLALGPGGAPSASAGYALRLEGDLERVLGSGIDVEVEQRSLSGVITAEAVDTIMRHVTEINPDLLVWQAGINDALAKANLNGFGHALDEVLGWLAQHGIDVLLIEPPYHPALKQDEHYKALVEQIQQVARKSRVPLVLRYEALRYLAQQAATRGQSRTPLSAFALNDLGARCIAEHVTRTVALSLLFSPSSRAPVPKTAPPLYEKLD